jgi:hypothetical protein
MCVTIDGVLDSILVLLTTLRLVTTVNYSPIANLNMSQITAMSSLVVSR